MSRNFPRPFHDILSSKDPAANKDHNWKISKQYSPVCTPSKAHPHHDGVRKPPRPLRVILLTTLATILLYKQSPKKVCTTISRQLI